MPVALLLWGLPRLPDVEVAGRGRTAASFSFSRFLIHVDQHFAGGSEAVPASSKPPHPFS